MKKKFSSAILALLTTSISISTYAEILMGQRIVGYYSCGTMSCDFVTPDAGNFSFEVADKKVAGKIFKKCKIDDVCAITGDFDIAGSSIIKVIKVANSGSKHKE